MPFTESLDVALIGLAVASVSALAPLATIIITSKQRRRDKLEDWKRQDAVAAKLLGAQKVTSDQNLDTQDKLRQIHFLVNSNLTKEMSDRLTALKGQMVLMNEVIRLNRLNKLEPTDNVKLALQNLDAAIDSLGATVDQRGRAVFELEQLEVPKKE